MGAPTPRQLWGDTPRLPRGDPPGRGAPRSSSPPRGAPPPSSILLSPTGSQGQLGYRHVPVASWDQDGDDELGHPSPGEASDRFGFRAVAPGSSADSGSGDEEDSEDDRGEFDPMEGDGDGLGGGGGGGGGGDGGDSGGGAAEAALEGARAADCLRGAAAGALGLARLFPRLHSIGL